MSNSIVTDLSNNFSYEIHLNAELKLSNELVCVVTTTTLFSGICNWVNSTKIGSKNFEKNTKKSFQFLRFTPTFNVRDLCLHFDNILMYGLLIYQSMRRDCSGK